MMDRILHDPIFFYAVAYVIFLGVAWVFLRKPGLQWLDGEIGKIRHEIDHARQLRADAEKFLAECAARKSAAIAEADAIVKHAKEEAMRLEAEAEANLKYVLARHEQHIIERIRVSEHEAVASVRMAVIDTAMAAVRKALATRLDNTAQTKLADQAIADMPRLVADQAKAA